MKKMLITGASGFLGSRAVKYYARHYEVFALTRMENRDDIERYKAENNDPALNNIHFVFISRSKLFGEYIYRLNRYAGFLGSYFVWQRSAYLAAKKLCREYDISLCHHVSIADVRCAGYLWKMGKPFIFGPVGGGQEIPECLGYYVRGHEESELFRSFMNKLCLAMPGYRRALAHAAVVYSSNDETTALLSAKMRRKDMGKLKQMTELCIDGQYIAQREDLQKQPTEVTHIIVSGRLIYRKGIALLLDAAAKIRTDYPFVVDIYGEGDQMNKLVRQAEELGIAQFVRFHGKISFEQMQQRYREADIYVLPSLRETTGTAVFEAMANKLPVVSLKQNGVKHIVETEMGILVELTSREQILEDMASALKTLIENPQLRREMGQAGFRKIQADYTWSGRAEYMRDVYEAVCRKENSF